MQKFQYLSNLGKSLRIYLNLEKMGKVQKGFVECSVSPLLLLFLLRAVTVHLLLVFLELLVLLSLALVFFQELLILLFLLLILPFLPGLMLLLSLFTNSL